MFFRPIQSKIRLLLESSQVDGRSFRVQLGPSPPASLDTSQPTSSALTWQIERKQMALPWPEYLGCFQQNN